KREAPLSNVFRVHNDVHYKASNHKLEGIKPATIVEIVEDIDMTMFLIVLSSIVDYPNIRFFLMVVIVLKYELFMNNVLHHTTVFGTIFFMKILIVPLVRVGVSVIILNHHLDLRVCDALEGEIDFRNDIILGQIILQQFEIYFRA
ncbi:hypothetical protein ACJX0J_025667, partial [Zea mays]